MTDYLIIGGTGSLGKEITQHIISNFSNIKKLIIFSRDEQKQFLICKLSSFDSAN